jgi:hypothetical protein
MFAINTSPTAIPAGFAMVSVLEFVVPDVALPRCTIKGSTQFILVRFEEVVKLKGLEIAEGKIESRKKTRVDSRRILIIDEEINRIKDQFTQVKIE